VGWSELPALKAKGIKMRGKLLTILGFVVYPFLISGLGKLLVFAGVSQAIMGQISGWLMIPWILIVGIAALVLRARLFWWVLRLFMPWTWKQGEVYLDRNLSASEIDKYSR